MDFFFAFHFVILSFLGISLFSLINPNRRSLFPNQCACSESDCRVKKKVKYSVGSSVKSNGNVHLIWSNQTFDLWTAPFSTPVTNSGVLRFPLLQQLRQKIEIIITAAHYIENPPDLPSDQCPRSAWSFRVLISTIIQTTLHTTSRSTWMRKPMKINSWICKTVFLIEVKLVGWSCDFG